MAFPRFAWIVSALALLAASPAAAQSVESRYAAPGPWRVDHLTTDGPCDREGNRCDIYYPQGGRRAAFAVVTWGNGTDATPSPAGKYDVLLRHIASWGFVVVATKHGSVGPGDTMLDALDAVKRANADPASPLFGRVDTARAAAAGHSQGASGAANAMLRSQGAIATAVLFHLPQQAFCNPADSCLKTADLKAATQGSLFYVSGSKDFIISPDWLPGGGGKLNSLTAYYQATPDELPKVKAILKDGDHNDLLGRPDCPPRQGGCSIGVRGYLAYPTAWLLWRVRGEDLAQAFQPGGELQASSDWTSVKTSLPR